MNSTPATGLGAGPPAPSREAVRAVCLASPLTSRALFPTLLNGVHSMPWHILPFSAFRSALGTSLLGCCCAAILPAEVLFSLCMFLSALDRMGRHQCRLSRLCLLSSWLYGLCMSACVPLPCPVLTVHSTRMYRFRWQGIHMHVGRLRQHSICKLQVPILRYMLPGAVSPSSWFGSPFRRRWYVAGLGVDSARRCIASLAAGKIDSAT